MCEHPENSQCRCFSIPENLVVCHSESSQQLDMSAQEWRQVDPWLRTGSISNLPSKKPEEVWFWICLSNLVSIIAVLCHSLFPLHTTITIFQMNFYKQVFSSLYSQYITLVFILTFSILKKSELNQNFFKRIMIN